MPSQVRADNAYDPYAIIAAAVMNSHAVMPETGGIAATANPT
jgi:hypothetical protein